MEAKGDEKGYQGALKKDFAERVYQVVKSVPRGKVATYGQVGAVLGSRKLARAVGNALHRNPYPDVPCHRVVNHQGKLAEKFGKGGWQEQKRRLLEEEVVFLGPRRIDLKTQRVILEG